MMAENGYGQAAFGALCRQCFFTFISFVLGGPIPNSTNISGAG